MITKSQGIFRNKRILLKDQHFLGSIKKSFPNLNKEESNGIKQVFKVKLIVLLLPIFIKIFLKQVVVFDIFVEMIRSHLFLGSKIILVSGSVILIKLFVGNSVLKGMLITHSSILEELKIINF